MVKKTATSKKSAPAAAPAKKKGSSRTRRAGLHIPLQHVKRRLTEELGGRVRLQRGAVESLAAATEFCLQSLCAAASDRIAGEGKHILAAHVFGAMNDEDADVRNVFPNKATGLFAY